MNFFEDMKLILIEDTQPVRVADIPIKLDILQEVLYLVKILLIFF